MQIVETSEEFDRFLLRFKTSSSFIIPILIDSKAHPLVNPLSALFVYIGSEWVILPFNHNDGVSLPQAYLNRLETPFPVLVPYKKTALQVFGRDLNFVDMVGQEYFKTKGITDYRKFYQPVMSKMYSMYDGVLNITKSIPFMVLIEYCEQYRVHLMQFYDENIAGFAFHNTMVVPTLADLERSGIYTGSIVYTDYNPYTAAGRITNKYATLSKSDGSRAMFTSRFNDGVLVSIDFDAFHLRLMAELIGYELPNGSVHEYLGKQYFKTDTLSPEQYEDSKKTSFALLYGNNRTTDIAFFQQIYTYVDLLWDTIQRDGYITSNTGRRIVLSDIDSPSPAKVFNYVLQLTEAEVTVEFLHQLLPLFSLVTSKIVLYTYDSILIDYSYSDGRAILDDTIQILENSGKYPVKIAAGHSYDIMTNITKIVKR